MKTKNTIQKLLFAIAILLLFLPIYKAVGQKISNSNNKVTVDDPETPSEEDFNDISLAAGTIYDFYLHYGNAVCKIDAQTFDGTGVLLNNTNKDGKMYVLTNAHLLPGFDITSDRLTFDIPSMNAVLSRYVFEFQFQRNGNPSSGSILKGAKIASLYYKNLDLSSNENYYISPTDMVLLELLERPNLTDGFIPYYAGWDFNYLWPEGENCILIHHPKGFNKKISMISNPLLGDSWEMKRYDSRTKLFDVTSNYDIEYSTDFVDNFPKNIPFHYKLYVIFSDRWQDMFNNDKLGIPTDGSSGAPFFNPMGKLTGIYQSSLFHRSTEIIEFAEALNLDKFNFNPYSDNLTNEYRPLAYYLNPTSKRRYPTQGLLPLRCRHERFNFKRTESIFKNPRRFRGNFGRQSTRFCGPRRN